MVVRCRGMMVLELHAGHRTPYLTPVHAVPYHHSASIFPLHLGMCLLTRCNIADTDVLVDYHKRKEFLRELLALQLPHGTQLRVSEMSGRPGTLKVFASGYPRTLLNPHLSWPFVDISFYEVIHDETDGMNYMVRLGASRERASIHKLDRSLAPPHLRSSTCSTPREALPWAEAGYRQRS